jgi:preprotein translocase subunit SecB
VTGDPARPPGIRIDSILLEGLSYHKSSELVLGKAYAVNINLNNEVQFMGKDQVNGRLVSKLKISEPVQGVFEFEIVYCLYASVIAEEANMPLADFLKNNASAIIYQFSRETLLSITQKAGIPIILPPLNVSAPQPAIEATQG